MHKFIVSAALLALSANCSIYDYPRRAYCRMQANPAYPTTSPRGLFRLRQDDPVGPVHITGWMHNLPYPDWTYAFSINEDNWDRRDCRSAGKHLQTPTQTHGMPSDVASHTGALWPIESNSLAGTSHSYTSWSDQTVRGPKLCDDESEYNPSSWWKSMVLYELGDDFGTGGTRASAEYGSSGPRIACCQIIPYAIDREADQEADPSSPGRRGAGRGLADELPAGAEIFTVDQYRELFGEEPERFPDQN